MRPEAHVDIAQAVVHGHEITRHAALSLEGGSIHALSMGIGLPRLWSMAAGAALRGFARGVTAVQGAARGRLDAGLAQAQIEVTRLREGLVEVLTLDATLLAVVLEGEHLHVMCVGPARAYLHRGAKPRRLTPREDPDRALLGGSATHCETPIQPGDLILAGSVSAFSVPAIGRLASVLDADPTTPPSVLASLLTEPAAKAGVGAVAAVLRIR